MLASASTLPAVFGKTNRVEPFVRERFERVLDEHPTSGMDAEPGAAGGLTNPAASGRLEALRGEALASLDALRQALVGLDVGSGGIGHNQLPEPIEGPQLTTEDVPQPSAMLNTCEAG